MITLKYGKELLRLFSQPGGKAINKWLIECDNDLYCSLVFRGGKALRAELLGTIGHEQGVRDTLATYDDDALKRVMSNLGGHCLEVG